MYYTNVNNLTDTVFHMLVDRLGAKTKEKILAYKDREAQLERLYGRLLLYKLLMQQGAGQTFSLDAMQYNEWNKPYFSAGFDFSIAHSGGMVICAGILGARVGVDLEKMTPGNRNDMREYFTESEWAKCGGDNTGATFYNIWVRKEALLKAIGKGVHEPLNRADVCADEVVANGVRWFFSEKHIKEGYACCVATDKPDTAMSVTEVDTETLINQLII